MSDESRVNKNDEETEQSPITTLLIEQVNEKMVR